MKWLVLIILIFPISAWAATRDNVINFTQECMTVEGDNLDLDGDGICEGLTGFRLYDAFGNFIIGITEDGTRSFNARYNMPWGLNQCHTLTAIMDDPINIGQVNESVISNLGACRDVIPGNPKPPVITN